MKIKNMSDGYSLVETLVALTLISTSAIIFFMLVANLLRTHTHVSAELFRVSRMIYSIELEKPNLARTDTLSINSVRYKYSFKPISEGHGFKEGYLEVTEYQKNRSIQIYCVFPVINDEQ